MTKQRLSSRGSRVGDSRPLTLLRNRVGLAPSQARAWNYFKTRGAMARESNDASTLGEPLADNPSSQTEKGEMDFERS